MSESPAAKPVPLAPAQQAALLPERLRGVPAAAVFRALELTGAVDADALDRAAVAVLTEHTALRTVFPDDRRVPYQRVTDVPATVLERLGTEAGQLDSAVLDDAGHRFDLVTGPPIRLRLHTAGTRTVLTVTAHPAVTDDHGIDLFTDTLLSALATGETPSATTRFGDLVPAQLKALTVHADRDPDLGHWLTALAGLPERAVMAAPVPPAGSGRSAVYRFKVDPATLAGLTGGHAPEAAFAALIARALGEAGLGDEVPVGVLDAARADTGTAAVIGPVANYLVLRLDSTLGTPADAVAAAARQWQEATAHASTRVERLTHQLGATDGLFQVAVGIRPRPVRPAVPGLEIGDLDRRVVRPHGADVVIDVVTDADGAEVTLQIPEAVHGLPPVAAFAANLARRVSSWAAGDDVAAGVTLFTAPAAEFDLLGLPGAGGPPQTDTERLITDAIRRVLDVDDEDEIGRKDTFFSLGGDSIAALRLVTDLAEHGYTVDLQEVFAHPSVHQLAIVLDEAGPDDTAGTAAPAAEVAPMAASGLDEAALAALGAKFAR